MTLIDAVQLLRQGGGERSLCYCGDTPERDRLYASQLTDKVRRLGLNSVVEFIGPVPQEQVVHWFRRCVAHVNCSPADHSLDKAALEAMACGKPSLSSTVGFRETMAQWADNLLFRHGDAEDLANKLVPLLNMCDAERHAMGHALRQSVVAGHSLNQLAQRLVDLFTELRGGPAL